MDDDELGRYLLWHALKYRQATNEDDLEAAWQELQKCVRLLIEEARTEERKAKGAGE